MLRNLKIQSFTYSELLNDIEKLKNPKLSEFSKNILNTPIEVKGIYSKDVKTLIKKYKDININDFELDKFYELNFLYFAIGLQQKKTLKDQVDFVFKNRAHLLSWGITDSTYQYFKVEDFNGTLPIIKLFISQKEEFLIRYGYLLLFNYIKDITIYKSVFNLFKNSDFFYVKMVEAWILSYLYIYDSKKTYDYLFSSDISFDIKNMAIRKILDSYRVNKEEKEKVKALRTILKEKKK